MGYTLEPLQGRSGYTIGAWLTTQRTRVGGDLITRSRHFFHVCPGHLPTSNFCQLAKFVNRILLPTKHFCQPDTFYHPDTFAKRYLCCPIIGFVCLVWFVATPFKLTRFGMGGDRKNHPSSRKSSQTPPLILKLKY